MSDEQQSGEHTAPVPPEGDVGDLIEAIGHDVKQVENKVNEQGQRLQKLTDKQAAIDAAIREGKPITVEADDQHGFRSKVNGDLTTFDRGRSRFTVRRNQNTGKPGLESAEWQDERA